MADGVDAGADSGEFLFIEGDHVREALLYAAQATEVGRVLVEQP
jgi:hypothetical protein